LGSETILIEQKPSKTEEGGGIEAELEAERGENSKESNSAAPQQAVRRHGSAKPLV